MNFGCNSALMPTTPRTLPPRALGRHRGEEFKDSDFPALPLNVHPRIQELLRRCSENEVS